MSEKGEEPEHLPLNALMVVSAILQLACQSGRVSEKDRYRIDGIGTFTVAEALDMADMVIAEASAEQNTRRVPGCRGRTCA